LELLSKYYQENIFPKDRQRLINRLAFCLEYNDIMENHYSKKTPITPNPLVIQVVKPKRDLYELAETRFHKMIEAGALDEVKSLHESKKISKTLYKAHGLPELLACIRNKMSLEDAIFDGIQNTKRYIKRQFTWWNNQKFSQLNLRINYKKSFPKDSIENISIYLNQ
jgi:tRNA dimethylallyltransferase